jgi:hypothetical protein
MPRARHPSKEVESAVAYGEALGWNVRMQGHWGRLYCPKADRDGCQVGVFGTPRDGDAHARQIKRAIDRCPHKETQNDGSDV